AGRGLRICREVGIECERARWLAALAVVAAQQTLLHAALDGVAALDLGHDVGEIPVQGSARAHRAVAAGRGAEVYDWAKGGGNAGGQAELLWHVLTIAG